MFSNGIQCHVHSFTQQRIQVSSANPFTYFVTFPQRLGPRSRDPACSPHSTQIHLEYKSQRRHYDNLFDSCWIGGGRLKAQPTKVWVIFVLTTQLHFLLVRVQCCSAVVCVHHLLIQAFSAIVRLVLFHYNALVIHFKLGG